ncbi:MAG: SIMPL domain-containing protein [Bdellovibrionales bacterium]
MNNNCSGRDTILAACILALGFGLGSFFIGAGVGEGLRHIHPPHVVTVKGLSERLEKADLALWTLQFSTTGNDLNGLQAKLEGDIKNVVDFLKGQGLDGNEITVEKLDVVDLLARQYRSAEIQNNRFILSATIRVRSDKVDLVQDTGKKIGTLIKVGVIFNSNEGGNSNAPQFVFTKINDIKLAMLAEATKNARAAAEQFARDSGESLGKMVEANQGIFSILAADGTGMGGDNYADQTSEKSQIMKKIRVVSTVKYALSN